MSAFGNSRSLSSSSAVLPPVARKITFAEYLARGTIKPRTTMSTTGTSGTPSSSSVALPPVARKITFAEYLARGTVKPRTPSSAVTKEGTTNSSTTTTTTTTATTNTTTTTVAGPPSPPASVSLSTGRSPASSPPTSSSPAPSRPAPVDVTRDASWTAAVLLRDTKLPGAPLVTRNIRLSNPLVRAKSKPKSAAAITSPPATRSPSPVATRQSTPSTEYDDLFEETPKRAGVQAAKQSRREAALARSAKITTGAISRAGNNPMANTRARMNRINKSVTSRHPGKSSRGGPRQSKIRKLAGSSGRWVDLETHSEASSAQLEVPAWARRQIQQQQPQTPLEAEVAARRAAEKEQYRREVDKLLAEAPRNREGACVAVLGDSRMSTVGFGNEIKPRRPEENPMWTTNAAVLHCQGGLKY